MAQLIPENTTRKIDSLGRVTLPKGLRNRLRLVENMELELFTAIIDNKMCVCMAKVVEEDTEVEAAIEFLESKGYLIYESGEDI